ncbi:MAG: ATP-binding protein [bacterium]|nr:ATP-binding protein [bacterium]
MVLKNSVIKRTIFELLKKHLSAKEISLIVGARQVGKTTLMRMLDDMLRSRGERTVWLNLDVESDRIFFDSQESLVKKLMLEFGKHTGYVFIDEIQRKENAGLFLKGLYDMGLPYKFIVSGSGSLELKEKIHESLLGRKRVFEMTPVSFGEFVNFKTENRYEGRLDEFFKIEKTHTEKFLQEYMQFGGYPRVITEDESREKERVINEIFESYIERDISYLLHVERIDAFRGLIKIFAEQTGNMVHYTELSSTLGISLPTIKNYIAYAEKTFVIRRAYPYFRNTRKEITKSPLIYFNDIGLRNYARGIFGRTLSSNDGGFLFQNFIANELRHIGTQSSGGDTRFWRSKDGAEVDIIAELDGEIIPIEVKYKNITTPSVERSMRSFIRKYAPQKALVVHLGDEGKMKINDTTVQFIPFTKLYTLFHYTSPSPSASGTPRQ